MTLDQDEQLLVDAFHRTHVTPPDLEATALRAARLGIRLRRRHQAGAAVATLAVVGVGVGGAALATGGHQGSTTPPVAGTSTPSVAVDSPTAPTSAPTSPAPSTPPVLDTSSAYAVLDAPGWTAPVDNVIADEKLYYVQDGTDAGLSLNWRPSPARGSDVTEEEQQAELDARYGGDVVVGTTTIDGDVAHVFGDHSTFTVVGPIRQGRFLTLSASGVTLDQITELATHVHRQEPAHLASRPQ
jgi:hypothetical protein